MIVFLFGFILLFITVLQAFTPKLLKQTEAFGVYVPEQYAKEQTIIAYKKEIYFRCFNTRDYCICSLYYLGINAISDRRNAIAY